MKRKVLVIAGATAVGKTSCSIAIAKQFSGEIINGDALQVYQGVNIGTAKITAAEMDSIPHHLIDTHTIEESYHVKSFQEEGRELIEAITNRGHLPIVCGGTGLYIKSLLYDYTFRDQAKDEDFIIFLETLSNAQLFALLKQVDHKACETIHPHNRKRMIRALEMAHLGDKKSDIIDRQEHKLCYDAYLIGLTIPRDQLHQRIEQRFALMMKQGLFEEVEGLVKSDPNIWERQCFQAIGYKEWSDYFNGKATIAQCGEQIIKNTKRFAKRQDTWFRNQLPMHWYDTQTDDWQKRIMSDVEQWLQTKGDGNHG